MENQDNNIILSVRGLSKDFGGLLALKNIDLDVKQGEKIAIIGGSGCGKSVFLRCCERLIKPDKGSVYICGENICDEDADIDKIRMNTGMVYQSYNLFSHMDVMDNLCLAPVHLLDMPREQAEEKAYELLKTVGMTGHEHSWPVELSGGQQQRVAIARCLMMNPKLIFLDEPTSALDPLMTGEVLATVRALGRQGMTMIIVTHEMNFAKNFADRILYFADGTIYEQGTPDEIFNHPKREKTIDFVYKLKHFSYHIVNKAYNLLELQNGIKAFIERYKIDPKLIWHLQLCTEELLALIVAKLEEEFDLNLFVEYSELNSYAILKVDWIGNSFDPFEDSTEGDNLGISILKEMSEEIKKWDENDRHYIEIKLV